VSLHDIKRTLRRKGVVVAMDAGHDFAFFSVGVGGDGEVWAFDWSVGWLGSRCVREWDGRWVDEGDGGGCELRSDWIRGDGGLDVVEGGVGLSASGKVDTACFSLLVLKSTLSPKKVKKSSAFNCFI
jgi:hypothetical protein